MYEILFETIEPYGEENSNKFGIEGLVAQNDEFRPKIDIDILKSKMDINNINNDGKDEFISILISLMKKCWNGDHTKRPNFREIVNDLSELQDSLSVLWKEKTVFESKKMIYLFCQKKNNIQNIIYINKFWLFLCKNYWELSKLRPAEREANRKKPDSAHGKIIQSSHGPSHSKNRKSSIGTQNHPKVQKVERMIKIVKIWPITKTQNPKIMHITLGIQHINAIPNVITPVIGLAPKRNCAIEKVPESPSTGVQITLMFPSIFVEIALGNQNSIRTFDKKKTKMKKNKKGVIFENIKYK